MGHPARPDRRVLRRRRARGDRADRTVFAVGDEKQSIFSFQGAAPGAAAPSRRRLSAHGRRRRPARSRRCRCWRAGARRRRSWLRRRGVRAAEALAGRARAGRQRALPDQHVADARTTAGCVDLWPLEDDRATAEERDPWAPVDAEPRGERQQAAGRGASPRRSSAMVDARRRGARQASATAARPCGYGDVLILVRRRNALFHEIIRALKQRGRAGGRRRPADALRAHRLRGPAGAGAVRPLPRRRPDPGGPAAQPVLRRRRGRASSTSPTAAAGPLWSALQAARRRAAGLGRGGAIPGLGPARGRGARRRSTSTAGCWPARRRRPLDARAPAHPAGRARRRTRSTPSWPRRWRPSGAACTTWSASSPRWRPARSRSSASRRTRRPAAARCG